VTVHAFKGHGDCPETIIHARGGSQPGNKDKWTSLGPRSELNRRVLQVEVPTLLSVGGGKNKLTFTGQTETRRRLGGNQSVLLGSSISSKRGGTDALASVRKEEENVCQDVKTISPPIAMCPDVHKAPLAKEEGSCLAERARAASEQDREPSHPTQQSEPYPNARGLGHS